MMLALRVGSAATSGLCRVDSMAFFLSGSTVRGVGRPTWRLDAELLCVLGVQSLPATGLHGIGTDDASNRLTGEKAIQHVEADVPAGSAHRNEATVDVVPEHEPGAAAFQRLQFPADVLFPPAEFEHLGRVGPLHPGLGYLRRPRPDCRELCGANGTEVPIGIERSPFAKMLGVGERLPDPRGRVAEVADEDERPLLPVFSDLGAKGGARRVLVTASHVSSFLSQMSSSPSAPGVAPAHRRASTRSGGRAEARRRFPGAVWD